MRAEIEAFLEAIERAEWLALSGRTETAGVEAIYDRHESLFDPAAFFALGGAVFYALAMISIRWLSATEPAATTVFYFTLFATIVGALTLPFQWQTPDVDGFVILAGIGLIGGIAQMAMTQAFRLAPASIVAPFEYLALVFAVGLGYAFWDEVPDAFIIAGSAIVIASGLYILHREAVRGRTAAGIDRAN